MGRIPHMRKTLKRASRGRVTIPVEMVRELLDGTSNANILAYTPKHGKHLSLAVLEEGSDLPANIDTTKPVGYHIEQDRNIMITANVINASFKGASQFVCRRNNRQLHLLPC